MNFSQIERVLRGAPDTFSSRDDARMEEALRLLKEEAVERNDPDRAKKAWRLEQTLKVQQLYIGAFGKMKSSSCYAAWCDLEKVEIALRFLTPHAQGRTREFWLDFIGQHTKQFQSLFPYKLFLSTELIHREMVCSICRRRISVRRPCEHRVGEIYNGEMCHREITHLDPCPGIALVTHPAHKYAVAFFGQEYNYGMVLYVVERLSSPFDGWSCSWTKQRHPHTRYADVGPDAPCPCESGLKYATCCLEENGVLRSHCDVLFDVAPPIESTLQYF